MQGNTGGSSFIFVGGRQNPEGAAGAMVLLAFGAAIYGIVYAIDVPSRGPLVDELISDSVTHCANAVDDETAYTEALREKFSGMWSSSLEKVTARKDMVVCVDESLNEFVMPYDYNDPVKRIWGEHRVMGVFYTDAYGNQAFVVKPESDIVPTNTIDDKPDRPLSLTKVMDGMNTISENVFHYELDNGTDVSVFIQRDGVSQEFGSKSIPDDDGKGWADEALMDEIQEHYEFNWPLVRSTGLKYTPQG